MADAYATVAATSPVTVYFDGDSANPVPVRVLSSYTPAVGDRVRVDVPGRGLLPVLQGKVG